MEKSYFRIFGFVFLFVGIFILMISRGGITGFVSFLGDEGETSIWGIVFVLIGLVLVFAGRDDRGLVRVVETDRFRKEIKRQNQREIQNALGKIGTGLGKEHQLRGGGDYSIRTSKGGRIIGHYADSHTFVLDGYTPNHNYKKVV